MRNAFAQELTRLAARDDRVVLLMGDIGNRLFNEFRDRFPSRFFNCGVAEANMMSVAAGLAMAGLRPVVYTITPFVTARCLEQIRVDVCYHRQPVVIVGVGAGLSYANLGPTHHSCDDIGFLRMLPHMQIVCAADAHETAAGLEAALQQNDPVYLRIGKKGEPLVHAERPKLIIGQGIPLQAGEQITILATGNMLPIAQEAASRLAASGLSTQLVSLHTVKPLDTALLRTCFEEKSLVVTVEEHSLIGGLGAAVAEWLADGPPQRARLLRIGTPDAFLHGAPSQTAARAAWGLDAESVVSRITDFHQQSCNR